MVADLKTNQQEEVVVAELAARSRRDRVIAVVDQAGWRRPSRSDLKVLDDWLLERAMEHDKLAVLLFVDTGRLAHARHHLIMSREVVTQPQCLAHHSEPPRHTHSPSSSTIPAERATHMGTMPEPIEILTARLRLRDWTDADRNNLAQMMADPEVMHDYGGPISQAESDTKLDNYSAGFERDGYSRWLIETMGEPESQFIGYVGVLAHRDPNHPLGPHNDIGWRLNRAAWGNGYATEAAEAALEDVFRRIGLTEVLSYTSATNRRSQAVMKRLNLVRDESRDFILHYPVIGAWTGLVWVANAPPG